MASLNTYLEQTQRFLRDQRQELLNPGDLREYVNRARREVAMRAQCLRVLTPISGAVTSASIVATGSGYSSSPTITITAPDFPSGGTINPGGAQATAAAIVQSGTISSVDITYGGAGYFQPSATVTDATGDGASVSLTVSSPNVLVANQEVYPFVDVNLDAFPGVESVYMIKSISILYSNFRYSLPCYSFSEYQAKLRRYPVGYSWVPVCCSQFGQGVSGSFYVYPVPSTTYQYELDCLCIPSDLTTNLSDEALPLPWTEAVPYMCAYLCYLELQNYNAAKFYLDQFDMFVNRYSTYARPGRAITMYGRP